jgi:hypothetical protein
MDLSQKPALNAEDAEDAEEGQEQKHTRELKPGIGGQLDTTPAFNFHMFSSFLFFLCVLCVLCVKSWVAVH